MSKAIYKPKGKAGEYAEWACNLYVGCSNDCSYCYCKKGVLSRAMGGPVPKLKTCFRNEQHAFEVFVKELDANIEAIRQSSLFFTFSSDPLIPETRALNVKCIEYAILRGVRCQVLTKNSDFIQDEALRNMVSNRSGLHYSKFLTFGFTLTGSDNLEPGASTNRERIAALRTLSDAGFRTFASVEPIIDFDRAIEMVEKASPWCDEYRFGLLSGDRSAYDGIDLHQSIVRFIDRVHEIVPEKTKLYWKESIRQIVET